MALLMGQNPPSLRLIAFGCQSTAWPATRSRRRRVAEGAGAIFGDHVTAGMRHKRPFLKPSRSGLSRSPIISAISCPPWRCRSRSRGPAKGDDYLAQFVLPNFYFHLAVAYATLRHNGVEIGKRDFPCSSLARYRSAARFRLFANGDVGQD